VVVSLRERICVMNSNQNVGQLSFHLYNSVSTFWIRFAKTVSGYFCFIELVLHPQTCYITVHTFTCPSPDGIPQSPDSSNSSLVNPNYTVSQKRPPFIWITLCQKLTDFNDSGMLNPEKIWQENLTDCPSHLSDVATVPWEIQVVFNSIIYTSRSHKKTTCNVLAHPPKAVEQQLLLVFFWAKVNNLKYMNNNVEKWLLDFPR